MAHPRVIWLQPWCSGCDHYARTDGRMWCQDDVWGRCDECGRKAIRYVMSRQPAPESAEKEG